MALSDRIKNFNENILVENKPEPSDLIKTNSVYTELHEALSAKIMNTPVWFEYTHAERENLISNFIKSYVHTSPYLANMPECELHEMQQTLLNTVLGFGKLDLILARENVKTVSVSVPDKIICTLKSGTVEFSDESLNEQQYNDIISGLVHLSGKNDSVIRFEFKDYLITIFTNQLCNPKLILEKLPKETVDFDYLGVRGIINEDIASFLKDSICGGKKILLSSNSAEAAELIINAIANSLPQEKNGIMFLKDSAFKPVNSSVSVFDVSDLSVSDRHTLIDKYLLFSPEFVISATEDNILNTLVLSSVPDELGCILPVIAGNPVLATSVYSVNIASIKNTAEKLAKAEVANFFDYIVQIENNNGVIRIQSINDIYTTKSGTPVLKEILKYYDKEYLYEKENLIMNKPVQKKSVETKKSKAANAFSSRLKDKK